MEKSIDEIGFTMKKARARVAALALLLCGAQAPAAQPDGVVGLWFNEEQDAKIELARCGDKYCGTIVWLKEPLYPAGSDEGTAGTPKVDRNNPDPARRKAPIIGLQIVRDFAYAGDDVWNDGKVYDPKNGKTYSGKMTLVAPELLDLRGYIGISLIGRTTRWTRARWSVSGPRCAAPIPRPARRYRDRSTRRCRFPTRLPRATRPVRRESPSPPACRQSL
jgi:uncharacterized protein (DUF2147 family)